MRVDSERRTAQACPSVSPAWPRPTLLLLAIAGLAVSGYLAITHYTTPDLLVCSANSVVDCESVTTSPQSVVLGIPVADLGVLYFAGLITLTVPAAWRASSPLPRLLRLGAAGTGVLFVVYLIAAELFLIGKICLYCTAVHAITLAIAAITTLAEFHQTRSNPHP